MAAGLALTVFSAQTGIASSTGDLERIRDRALELVNQTRQEHGLPQLELGVAANDAAQAHAEDMLKRSYYSHSSPEGETVRDRYVAAGGSKWRLTAENIARCEDCNAPPEIEIAERLHRGWMNSPGHRENILRHGLDVFGYGIIASDGEGLYAVQTFAGPGRPLGVQPGEQPMSLSVEEQVSAALRGINRARNAAGVDRLDSSETLTAAAQSILPKQGADPFTVDVPSNVSDTLPPSAGDWRSLAILVAVCGGCGVEPTEADVRYFVEQWLDHPQNRDTLLRDNATHLGFTIAANGSGKKIAVGVLGAAR